jgi:hypothetical protein
MSEFTPLWQQPSHPDRIEVVKSDQPYKSYARSLISLPAGASFAKISTAAFVERDTYISVTTGKDSRIELNSDIVYCNHSCNPSLIFDVTRFEVRVAEDRPLAVGDHLTYFYPSTEWKMVQPFRCQCGAGPDKCLGFVFGASNIEPSVLMRYWLNEHIHQLLKEKTQASAEG